MRQSYLKWSKPTHRYSHYKVAPWHTDYIHICSCCWWIIYQFQIWWSNTKERMIHNTLGKLTSRNQIALMLQLIPLNSRKYSSVSACGELPTRPSCSRSCVIFLGSSVVTPNTPHIWRSCCRSNSTRGCTFQHNYRMKNTRYTRATALTEEFLNIPALTLRCSFYQ